jgi:hypothetical protein
MEKGNVYIHIILHTRIDPYLMDSIFFYELIYKFQTMHESIWQRIKQFLTAGDFLMNDEDRRNKQLALNMQISFARWKEQKA